MSSSLRSKHDGEPRREAALSVVVVMEELLLLLQRLRVFYQLGVVCGLEQRGSSASSMEYKVVPRTSPSMLPLDSIIIIITSSILFQAFRLSLPNRSRLIRVLPLKKKQLSNNCQLELPV